MEDGYDEQCNLVRTIPSCEWCLAVSYQCWMTEESRSGYILPYEVEQNESTDSQVSADPVNLAIWVNRLVFWNQDDRHAVHHKTE